MTADRWTGNERRHDAPSYKAVVGAGLAVRDQLRLGRLLPLGDRRDGAWITEAAAEAVLRRAAQNVPGVRPGALRIALADPEEVYEPAVPPPPSALPPGPLRITADFAATVSEPLPATASLVRAALETAATEGLGLSVTAVDLRVTGLLDEEPQPSPVPPPEPPAAEEASEPDEARAAAAALAVPGVARLTGALGGRSVHIGERRSEAALPHRHARVEITVLPDHRALDVARAVRTVVGEVLPDHPTVAVLVTAVS
ncbi:nucleopolyhedrovirus P10 family protein [Streptomyces sp. NPDC002088]|uniref:nucleopolyhedrovirus P10 family protein n=1 Tax=Streptomyces sp. NPDC002088 TaxID=3154665 RepID=UPI00332B2255